MYLKNLNSMNSRNRAIVYMLNMLGMSFRLQSHFLIALDFFFFCSSWPVSQTGVAKKKKVTLYIGHTLHENSVNACCLTLLTCFLFTRATPCLYIPLFFLRAISYNQNDLFVTFSWFYSLFSLQCDQCTQSSSWFVYCLEKKVSVCVEIEPSSLSQYVQQYSSTPPCIAVINTMDSDYSLKATPSFLSNRYSLGKRVDWQLLMDRAEHTMNKKLTWTLCNGVCARDQHHGDQSHPDAGNWIQGPHGWQMCL